MFNTLSIVKKRNKAFDHMLIKRHQKKKKKRHEKDVVVKNMCINEKRKGHLPDGNLSMYMRYFVPAGSIYLLRSR